jgi:hypothetical protein
MIDPSYDPGPTISDIQSLSVIDEKTILAKRLLEFYVKSVQDGSKSEWKGRVKFPTLISS